MIRGFILSFLIHLIFILSIFFSFKTSKLGEKNNIKTISLSHIVVKKRIEKQEIKQKKQEIKKVEKQEKPKKQEKRKIIKKKIVKKKKKIVKKGVKKKYKQKVKSHSRAKKIKKDISKKVVKVASYQQKYMNLNKSKIYEEIQKVKRYPKMAKRLKKQGRVDICFDLLPSGEAKNIQTSRAHPLLQKGAYKTIIEASSNFPKPKKKIKVCTNINYKLF